ncbi:hypothetical protein DV738_g4897, partial [Chaetothyriales sp. CBS 135597]
MGRKQWLAKGGLHREDSDDELGYDDLPWEWIYAQDSTPENQDGEHTSTTPSRKRKATSAGPESNRKKKQKQQIIGAKMGTFSVMIGDAVLLKSPEQGKDWVALVCAFSEVDEDGEPEMCAHVQWFCSPDELAFSKRSNKRKPDTLPNESYITADFNLNPLTSINGKAIVLSKEGFFKKYPEGKEPKSKEARKEYTKTILCRKGVKQRSLIFTEEFAWDEIYRGPEDMLDLVDWIKEQTKRIIVKRPLEITPLGTRMVSPSQFMELASAASSTPYAHARRRLHVSAVPGSLPCRSEEFAKVYSHLQSAIMDGYGACIYISGTPGTGKTATVREVVASLHQAVLAEELDDFTFVEINGMKVTEPAQAYSLLWEALKGDRVSPVHALSLLEHEFSHPSPRRVPCVVLMDELDQLVTGNQSVMYNLFNWPALRHSRLIVLAVANTMDLPERTLSNKISSRLGLTRITFPGYSHQQLMEIIAARLQGVPGNIVDADAVQFASRKVAAVSGDARRALDICRRAVEIAEQQQEREQGNDGDDDNEGAQPATPSKTGRKPPPTPTTAPTSTTNPPLKRVTIATIKQAINEATSSPMAQHLRSLPLACKLFLGGLLARTRRTGVAESSLGEVVVEACRIADVSEVVAVQAAGEIVRAEGPSAAATVVAELVQSGIVIVMEARRKGERAARVRLRIGEEEVKSAMVGDPDVVGMGFL